MIDPLVSCGCDNSKGVGSFRGGAAPLSAVPTCEMKRTGRVHSDDSHLVRSACRLTIVSSVNIDLPSAAALAPGRAGPHVCSLRPLFSRRPNRRWVNNVWFSGVGTLRDRLGRRYILMNYSSGLNQSLLLILIIYSVLHSFPKRPLTFVS